MTKEQELVMEGNKEADELGREGVFGWRAKGRRWSVDHSTTNDIHSPLY